MSAVPPLDDDASSIESTIESAVKKRAANEGAALVAEPKAKRPVSEKTLANLAKGRETRDANRVARKRTRDEESKLQNDAKDAESKLRAEKRAALAKLVDETVNERLKLKAAVEEVGRAKAKRAPKKRKVEESESESESDGELQQKRPAAKKVVVPPPPAVQPAAVPARPRIRII